MGLGSSLKKAVGLGGGGVRLAPPTPEERALQQQQLQLVQRFGPIFGDLIERAIEGEVPADLALEEQLREREQATLEDIRRRGGVGAEATTTAGIQRLGRLRTGADIARQQTREAQKQFGLQGLEFVSGVAGETLGRLQRQRLGQFEAAQQLEAQKQAQRGALGGLIGKVGAGALLGPAAGLTALQGAGLSGIGGAGLIPQFGQQRQLGMQSAQAGQAGIRGALGALRRA